MLRVNIGNSNLICIRYIKNTNNNTHTARLSINKSNNLSINKYKQAPIFDNIWNLFIEFMFPALIFIYMSLMEAQVLNEMVIILKHFFLNG